MTWSPNAGSISTRDTLPTLISARYRIALSTSPVMPRADGADNRQVPVREILGEQGNVSARVHQTHKLQPAAGSR